MKNRQIINIVNFIRAVEPRMPMDLITPIREQIRLMKKHHLKGTFLLQYDALITPEIMALFDSLDPRQFEFGIWHEIVQPQVEACGIPWRGRFPWDWHTDCGFSVGYTKSQREQLIDVTYHRFYQHFGYYPRVVGSWLHDTHTLRYISEKYGADAFCNCKEQYGTDGYTLWGGYYGQGYYPSRSNAFLPAQQPENQISVPLFRMLGSDPVYQYDLGLDPHCDAPVMQEVISLEPVYPNAGSNPQWVDWYMRENFNGDCLSFGYAQAGQENSFGWDKMKKGLCYQFPLFEKWQQEGKIAVETLGETGRWYSQTYSQTPASAITAHTAYDDEDKNSVWYSSRFYRVNLFGDHGQMRIRDLHLFSDRVTDPHEDEVCTQNHAVYEALPWIDGCRYSGKGVLAGGYLVYEDGSQPSFDKMTFTDAEKGKAVLQYGDVTVTLTENRLCITCPRAFRLENRIGIDGGHLPETAQCTAHQLDLQYLHTAYAIRLEQGTFWTPDQILSENNTIEILLQA